MTTRNISTFLTLGALLAALLPGCAQLKHQRQQQAAQLEWNQVRARIKLQLAAQQFDTGHAADAVATAAEALALDPTAPEAYVLLVRAQLEADDLFSAEQTLAAATQADVRSSELTYLRGVMRESRGQLEEALALYQQARTENPQSLDSLVAEVECMVALGRTEAAVARIEENLDRLGADGTLATLAARIADLTGDVELGERMYRQALRVVDDPALAFDYGMTLVRRERFAEARMVLEPLLEERAETVPMDALCLALGHCRLALNEPRAALDVLERQPQFGDTDPRVQLLRAAAALKLGDHRIALQSANAILAAEPSDPDALLVIAAVQMREHRWQAAEETLGSLLEFVPQDEMARDLRREVQLRLAHGPDVPQPAPAVSSP